MIDRAAMGTTTDPVSIVVLMVGLAGFAAAVLATRIGRGGATAGGRRDRASLIGIALQAVSFAIVSGPLAVAGRFDSVPPRALETGLLMAVAIALFAWAARTMGANWAIVAQTRADHQLVTGGPFAIIRNPIYLAMALVLLAVAVATNHARALLIAAPLFAIGTAIRIRAEERLLTEQFGDAYRAYAARVKRIIPGLL